MLKKPTSRPACLVFALHNKVENAIRWLFPRLTHPVAHHATCIGVFFAGVLLGQAEHGLADWCHAHLPAIATWLAAHGCPLASEVLKAAGIIPYADGVAAWTRIQK